MTAPDPVILRTSGVSKIYPGTLALDQVDFIAHRGKVNVLIGENGAGKSTLMKILAGVEAPSSGEIFLNGEKISFASTRDAAHAGVGIIYQELNLFPNLSIAENIFAGRELTQGGVLALKTQRKLTLDLLRRLDQPLQPDTLVADLRMGQQQVVEIAKALSLDAQILIMDEPTSALTVAETEALFRIIGDLKGAGVTIIYISHKLEELLEIGDYVTVLRDGKLAAHAPAREVTVTWIIEKMVGKSVNLPKREGISRKSSAEPPLLTVNGLTLPRVGSGFTLHQVSFTLARGEILGIYGLMGAGRTELLECLMGLHPEAAGEITLRGAKLRSQNLAARIASGINLVPEDRQRLGLVQQLSIAHNITLASLRRFVTNFWLSAGAEDQQVARMIKELSIKTKNATNPITSLSGGNQQKVVFAKALLTEPQILLLDEPTRGIDVGAKAEIFAIMAKLALEGYAIIFVSSELPEILAIPDRTIVLAKGVVTGHFRHDEATEELLIRTAGGREAVPLPS